MKCNTCGKDAKTLHPYKDSVGDNYFICDECYNKVSHGKCIKCGKDLDEGSRAGLCKNCLQVKLTEDAVEYSEEDSDAVADILKDYIDNFTGEQPSEEVIEIFAYMKIFETGISRDKYNLYMPDVIKLTRSNVKKVIKKKVRLIIDGETPNSSTNEICRLNKVAFIDVQDY